MTSSWADALLADTIEDVQKSRSKSTLDRFVVAASKTPGRSEKELRLLFFLAMWPPI